MDFITLVGQLINTTLVFATALVFAALGGIFSERSGVTNLGIEGFMIFGAFAAGVTTHFAQEAGMSGFTAAVVGLVVAAIFGLVMSLIHAVASITFKADQIISGIVINFLAAGSTLYMVKLLFDGQGETPLIQGFAKWNPTLFGQKLAEIPFIGPVFINHYPTTFLAVLFVIAAYYILYKTPYGLRLRSVGEHPSAADTMGINVTKYRYVAVMVSGALAAIGGATLTLTSTGVFSHNTISGQGYIAIAAMIFGKWNPIGAFGAAMFFGFSQALKNYIQLFDWAQAIPQEIIFMLPYLLTIIVLVAAVGRSSAPAALGQPYDPSKR